MPSANLLTEDLNPLLMSGAAVAMPVQMKTEPEGPEIRTVVWSIVQERHDCAH